MSVKIMGMVWDFYPAGGGELLTALKLADHADHDGGSIHPGIAGLAKYTRQSERTIQNHVGEMRSSTWLQPVRYMKGGYGRATEYRINPAWVADPANFAPFQTRVQFTAQKGATDDNLGCKIIAPQPSLTVSSKTTTTENAPDPHDAVVVGNEFFEELDFPPVFCGERRNSALQILESCPVPSRQQVLYEVAGIIERGALRGSPIGLLQGLSKKSREGLFVPSHGIAYAEKQRMAREARAKADAESALRKQSDPAKNREAAKKAIAAFRERSSGGNP